MSFIVLKNIIVEKNNWYYTGTVNNSAKNPTLSTITKLAKALGVSVDELLK